MNKKNTYYQAVKGIDEILVKGFSKKNLEEIQSIIHKEKSLEKYFFKSLTDSDWLHPLIQKGYFNPHNAPGYIKVNDGFQIPYWPQLGYLVKLSDSISKGLNEECIQVILDITTQISKKGPDNYNTWNTIIQILYNFPNDKITIEILTFVPIWLKSQFDVMSTSHEICEKLLPKFLHEKSSHDDINKAECILLHILELKQLMPSNGIEVDGIEKSRYVPTINIYWLMESLISRRLIERVGRFCSSDIAFKLADNLKTLMLDYPAGLKFTFKSIEKEFTFNVFVDEKNLTILIYTETKKNQKRTILLKKINNFEKYQQSALFELLNKEIEYLGINVIKSEELNQNINRIVYSLNNDLSTIWCNSIHKIQEDRLHRDDPLYSYTYILRDFLISKGQYNKVELRTILKTFTNSQYYLPFFKRMIFYVISEYWNDYKDIFWDLVKDQDANHFFSKYHYRKELYYLLQTNIKFFSKEERKKIVDIINDGPQEGVEDKSPGYKEYWQFQWYSAMKEDEDFIAKFDELSKKRNLTSEHFEELGKVKIKRGYETPITKEEILKLDNNEIVKYIFDFQPKDRWKEPSIDGFTDAISKAVQEDPEKFANEIDKYSQVYLTYAYHIIQGFINAWKDKKLFNWKNVLNFCLNYIESDAFLNDELIIEGDSWGVNKEWIWGEIGRLIVVGTEKDENAFNSELLPLAKKTLFSIIPRLKIENRDIYNDYPTYSLNSTQGKVLSALINYSLRCARLKFGNDFSNTKKWDDSIKELYESTINKGIIDAFILQGFYFRQLLYLDREWITQRIIINKDLDENNWRAFMGGFLFNNAVSDEEIYNLMVPHYQKALAIKEKIIGIKESDIARHLLAYYFWGYEDIKEGSLLPMFLNNSPANEISNLVHYMWAERDNIDSISTQKKKEYISKVLIIWNFISQRFKNDKDEKSRELLAQLSKLSVYLDEINDESLELLLISAKCIIEDNYTYIFLQELVRLKDKGDSLQTAYYIAKILKALIDNYKPYYDQKQIITLVSFLYDNKKDTKIKGIADEICNEYGRQGMDFLRELYEKNNK